jgi:hypothetical protein
MVSFRFFSEQYTYVRFSLLFLFLFSWSGVRLSPFGALTTKWPIAPATSTPSVNRQVLGNVGALMSHNPLGLQGL